MSKVESINKLERDLFHKEEVARFADPKAARKKAMDYLARREYGQRELEEKLVAAGFEATTAIDAVDRLTGEGLQDDRRFAESFVQSRINQGKGPVRIRQELADRKLSTSLIDATLEAADADWFELARDIRRKKFGGELPGEFAQKARQMRFLKYRGFETAHIQAAVAPHGDD